jgi:hypothetical protein
VDDSELHSQSQLIDLRSAGVLAPIVNQVEVSSHRLVRGGWRRLRLVMAFPNEEMLRLLERASSTIRFQERDVC